MFVVEDDAAFEALLDVLDVVLEALEGVDALVVDVDDVCAGASRNDVCGGASRAKKRRLRGSV